MDALKAHSDMGAAGWNLLTMPEKHPPEAVGYYGKGDKRAFLVFEDNRYQIVEAEER